MLQRCRHADFTLKPLDLFGRREQMLGNHLDGDRPVHRPVNRLEDHPHATRVEQVEDQVFVDQQFRLPFQECRRLIVGQLSLRDELRSKLPRIWQLLCPEATV